MTLDQTIHTSDFLNILVYDLTTGGEDIMVRVELVFEKMEENDFPNSNDYGIPKAIEKPTSDLIALKGYYIKNPSNDNAVMVAEAILELFIATDAYIAAF